MVENGFVYAISKDMEKRRKAEQRGLNKKEKALDTIKAIQNKYDFCFGYMTTEDTNKLTKTDKTKYYKAIKLTSSYNNEILSKLGLC